MAALEGGTAAVATASGHAAEFMAIAAIANAGDNLVSSLVLTLPIHSYLRQLTLMYIDRICMVE